MRVCNIISQSISPAYSVILTIYVDCCLSFAINNHIVCNQAGKINCRLFQLQNLPLAASSVCYGKSTIAFFRLAKQKIAPGRYLLESHNLFFCASVTNEILLDVSSSFFSLSGSSNATSLPFAIIRTFSQIARTSERIWELKITESG